MSICLAGDNQRAVAGGSDGRVYVFDMHSGCLVRTIATSHSAKVSGVKVTSNDDFLITAGKSYTINIDILLKDCRYCKEDKCLVLSYLFFDWFRW